MALNSLSNLPRGGLSLPYSAPINHTHAHQSPVPASLGGGGWEGEGVELTVVFTFCTWCVTPLSSGTVPRPLSVSTGPMTVMPLFPMATTTMEYLTSSGHWSFIPSVVNIANAYVEVCVRVCLCVCICVCLCVCVCVCNISATIVLMSHNHMY